jgi:hypothetical protein
MLRWILRYGAIRMVGRRALPVLMVWDAARLANRTRQIPVVDRSIRRGVAAAAERFADTLDGLTPSVGRSARSSDAADDRRRDVRNTGAPGADDRRRRRPGS